LRDVVVRVSRGMRTMGVRAASARNIAAATGVAERSEADIELRSNIGSRH
jgi:hypothetical protein